METEISGISTEMKISGFSKERDNSCDSTEKEISGISKERYISCFSMEAEISGICTERKSSGIFTETVISGNYTETKISGNPYINLAVARLFVCLSVCLFVSLSVYPSHSKSSYLGQKKSKLHQTISIWKC